MPGVFLLVSGKLMVANVSSRLSRCLDLQLQQFACAKQDVESFTKIPILMTSLREVVEGKPIWQLLRAAANCLSKLYDGGIIWLFCLYETCQETNEHCICHGMPVNLSFLAAGQLVVAIVS